MSVGLGKHIWSPGVEPFIGSKLLFAIDLVYITSITFIRISVVLFYYRIFGKDRWYKRSLWITFSILVSWWIAISLLAIFRCSPVARQWDYSIPGHCYSLHGTCMGVTVSNVFLDLLILILPLPMLSRLQINMKKKPALIANFMLGYRSATAHSTCVGSIRSLTSPSVIVVTVLRLLSIIRVPTDAVEDLTCE